MSLSSDGRPEALHLRYASSSEEGSLIDLETGTPVHVRVVPRGYELGLWQWLQRAPQEYVDVLFQQDEGVALASDPRDLQALELVEGEVSSELELGLGVSALRASSSLEAMRELERWALAHRESLIWVDRAEASFWPWNQSGPPRSVEGILVFGEAGPLLAVGRALRWAHEEGVRVVLLSGSTPLPRSWTERCQARCQVPQERPEPTPLPPTLRRWVGRRARSSVERKALATSIRTGRRTITTPRAKDLFEAACLTPAERALWECIGGGGVPSGDAHAGLAYLVSAGLIAGRRGSWLAEPCRDDQVRSAVASAGGNPSRAAETLGWRRSTVLAWMRRRLHSFAHP